MDDFEKLLERHRGAVERFVYFRLPSRDDAEDVLQEVYLAAYRSFSQLRSQDAFKAWILRIAQNQCSAYFRQRAVRAEIPLSKVSEGTLSCGRRVGADIWAVRETLGQLSRKDRQILRLFFLEDMPQEEIARLLEIPQGTVKSRVYTAKKNFRGKYPFCTGEKGESDMKKLPVVLPEYRITESDQSLFAVRWEELMGWFIVPRLGEKLKWGIYDSPTRRRSLVSEIKAVGKAVVHGLEGVEIEAKETETDASGKKEETRWRFVVQLTDTHCRHLAAWQEEEGMRRYITFLDDAFMPEWGWGEENCGKEIDLAPKGDIRREGAMITAAEKAFLLDVVGRYTVEIGGRKYDTVCVISIDADNGGAMSEQFLDANGRTVLWRRFNPDDWRIERYGMTWSERLPESERLTVNGKTYVHWYDCITEYIL